MVKTSKIRLIGLSFIICHLSFSAALTSCTDKLDEIPDNRTFIDTPQKVRKLLTSAYPVSTPAVICELSGDNYVDDNVVVPATHNGAYQQFNDEAYQWEDINNYSINSDDTPYQVWEAYYAGISVCNHAIEAMMELSSDPAHDAETSHSWGEAHVLRAYLHFILVNVFAEAYKNNELMKMAFLKENGMNIKMPYKAKEYANGYDSKLFTAIANKFDYNGYLDGLNTMNVNQILTKYGSEVNHILHDWAEGHYNQKLADKLYPLDDSKELAIRTIDNVFRETKEYFDDKKNGKTKQIDSQKLTKRINNALRTKKAQAEYETWLKDVGKNVIEKRGVRNDKDVFTSSGNRRSFEQLYYQWKRRWRHSRSGVRSAAAGDQSLNSSQRRPCIAIRLRARHCPQEYWGSSSRMNTARR